MSRLRGELRDLLELVLIPGLAIFLPWTWCYRVFRLISRWERLYWTDATENCRKAQQHGRISDPADCRRKWRLMAMVDQADFYLAMSRRNAWMNKHMDVDGEWPTDRGPAIFCTFHWGAGMWALRHLGAAGFRAHALVGPQRPDMFPGHRLRYEYYRVRNIAVRNALATEPLDITGSLRTILKALRAGEQIAAAVDVPAYLSAASQAIPFLGKRARMPRGLFRLAVDQGVPVTIFINGLDFATGRRFLRIYSIGVEKDVDMLMAKVYAHLEALIREEPSAWHFWRISNAFFDEADH